MVMDQFAVYDDYGHPIAWLNPELIKKQGLSKTDVLKLAQKHSERHKLKEVMKAFLEKGDFSSLRKKAKEMTALEFELQDLWRFERDESFHEWYELPGCTCPKMDNRERKGTKYQMCNSDCPLHGEDAQEPDLRKVLPKDKF
jgi:hypothetical protein